MLVHPFSAVCLAKASEPNNGLKGACCDFQHLSMTNTRQASRSSSRQVSQVIYRHWRKRGMYGYRSSDIVNSTTVSSPNP